MAFDELDRLDEPIQGSADRWKGLSDKDRTRRFERHERVGLVPPQNDGFWGEMADGSQYVIFTNLRRVGEAFNYVGFGDGLQEWTEEVLGRNKQWRRPEYFDGLSYFGRLLGEWVLLDGPVLLIILFFIWKYLKKWTHRRIDAIKQKLHCEKMKKDESRKLALSEIESGNLDKLTWANAMVKAKGDEEKAKAEYIRIRKI